VDGVQSGISCTSASVAADRAAIGWASLSGGFCDTIAIRRSRGAGTLEGVILYHDMQDRSSYEELRETTHETDPVANFVCVSLAEVERCLAAWERRVDNDNTVVLRRSLVI